MQIVAISGSLRLASINTQLLYATQSVAPPSLKIEIFNGIGDLPHFNPDRESDYPLAVSVWRDAVRDTDAVIFSTPEYAHGLPGSLKNALDWLVGSGELANKPFALFNTSPRGTFAQASLTEIVSTMAGRHVRSADVTLFLQRSTNEDALTLTPEQTEAVRAALETLRRACEGKSLI
ncbi:MAG: NAD(P)H-dependent oxidoreductase [Armatimonadetes bacterium]|nr:NAD(P)H-dependent oxidoreductase [Armatimonadota bacterium]